MSIHMIKIRAKIEIGSLIAGTPPLGYDNHILSFNVDKARGRVSNFSASIKVKHADVSGTIQGDNIKIYAGTVDSMPLIYTGIVRTANMGPCREDPGFVILNIGGEDILSNLNGKKFTRRCRSSRGVWVSIEGLTRPGLRSGNFQYIPQKPWLESTGAEVKEIGPVVKTKQIPNPTEKTEKVSTTPAIEQEVSIQVSHVDRGR